MEHFWIHWNVFLHIIKCSFGWIGAISLQIRLKGDRMLFRNGSPTRYKADRWYCLCKDAVNYYDHKSLRWWADEMERAINSDNRVLNHTLVIPAFYSAGLENQKVTGSNPTTARLLLLGHWASRYGWPRTWMSEWWLPVLDEHTNKINTN